MAHATKAAIWQDNRSCLPRPLQRVPGPAAYHQDSHDNNLNELPRTHPHTGWPRDAPARYPTRRALRTHLPSASRPDQGEQKLPQRRSIIAHAEADPRQGGLPRQARNRRHHHHQQKRAGAACSPPRARRFVVPRGPQPCQEAVPTYHIKEKKKRHNHFARICISTASYRTAPRVWPSRRVRRASRGCTSRGSWVWWNTQIPSIVCMNLSCWTFP